MPFGATPTDNVGIPLGSVYVPGTAGSDLTALQGGPSSTDGNGQKSAPVATYTPDGNDQALGAKADASASTDTGTFSLIALVKRLLTKIPGLGQATMAGSLPVVVASNQSAIPVSMSGASYGAAFPATGTAIGAKDAGNNLAALLLDASGNLKVVLPGTQAVSGTVTMNAGTGTMSVEAGGSSSTAIASGTAGNTVVKNSAGRLASILVYTTGTNPLLIYDNASTPSGTIIGALPASPAIGLYIFGTPAANGITVAGNAANPGITVFYS